MAAWQSLLRIESFLLAEEKVAVVSPSRTSSDEDIVLTRAFFGYGPNTFLHDISATIPHRKLTLVIGKVGSVRPSPFLILFQAPKMPGLSQGKSTFLHACMGEVDRLTGSLVVPSEETAYAAQDVWLRNESIRDAITFTSKYDEEWYETVVAALALDVDLDVRSFSGPCETAC